MVERAFRRDDAAASDFVATVLLILAVVLLGGGLSAIVMGALADREPTPAETYALAPPDAGDDKIAVRLSNGGPVTLSTLRLTLERGGGAPVDIDPTTWTTPDSTHLNAGETLTFPVSPVVASDETILVRIYRSDLNALAAQLAGRSGFALPSLAPATITVQSPSPTEIPADATATSLVTTRIEHQEGLLAVSEVYADVGGVGRLLVPLNDQGRDGDVLGGDGLWSGLARFPTSYPAAAYPVYIHVVDGSGRTTVASSTPYLNALSPSLSGDGSGGATGATNGTDGSDGTNSSTDGSGGTGGSGGSTPTGATGNFTGNTTGTHCCNTTGNFTGNGTGEFQGNFSGNSTGNHSGPVVGDIDGAFIGLGAGKRATEGTRFKGPTSSNVSTFRLVNWSWDRLSPAELNDDAMVIHVVGGNRTWSVYLKFDYDLDANYAKKVPKLTHMRIWNFNNETWYKATSTLDLATLNLDLLTLGTSGQWAQLPENQIPTGDKYVNLTNNPGAQYQYAQVQDNPFLVISYMRDEKATGQGAKSLDKGIFTVDVEFV